MSENPGNGTEKVTNLYGDVYELNLTGLRCNVVITTKKMATEGAAWVMFSGIDPRGLEILKVGRELIISGLHTYNDGRKMPGDKTDECSIEITVAKSIDIDIGQISGNITIGDTDGDVTITSIRSKVSMGSVGSVQLVMEETGEVEIAEVKGPVIIYSCGIEKAKVTGDFSDLHCIPSLALDTYISEGGKGIMIKK